MNGTAHSGRDERKSSSGNIDVIFQTLVSLIAVTISCTQHYLSYQCYSASPFMAQLGFQLRLETKLSYGFNLPEVEKT